MESIRLDSFNLGNTSSVGVLLGVFIQLDHFGVVTTMLCYSVLVLKYMASVIRTPL